MAGFGVGETIAISAAMAAASASAAAAQASAQRTAANRSADAQRNNARNAAEANQRQASAKASVDRRNAITQTQRTSGRIRTAAAEAGVGVSGSYAALEDQAAIDGGNNLRNLGLSQSFTRQSIQSGLDVSLANIVNQPRSTAMEAFNGGLGGFSTGLSLTSSYNNAAGQQRERNALEQIKANQ